METIYLIGFMGSGKSTVGRLLHEALEISYLDTDQMIIDTYGDIASIFQQSGEGQFRDYETEMLKRAPTNDYVVSTGGGIVERQENKLFMKQNGLIIYLETSFAEVVHRLGNDPARPMWGQNDYDKQQLFRRRSESYSELADVMVNTDHKSPQNVTSEILERMS